METYDFIDLKKNLVPGKWLSAFVLVEDIGQSLKKNFSPLTPPTSPSEENGQTGKSVEITWDANACYEVEKIIRHVRKRKRFWYLVKWKGWSNEHNTLESLENLTGCNYLLRKYWERSKPTRAEMKRTTREIETALLTNKFYGEIVMKNYGKKEVVKFFEECMHIPLEYILFGSRKAKSRTQWLNEEYNHVVRCLVAMAGNADPEMFRRAQNYLICLKLAEVRKRQLRSFSDAMNVIRKTGERNIEIANDVDFECFPSFEYVTEMKHYESIVVPGDPPLGCECHGGCSKNRYCCGPMAGTVFAYSDREIITTSHKIPIYECNKKCKCPSDCPNRVVQHGRKVAMCIFKTETCGWGVKALERIRRGTFVCEYIGELIKEKEAIVRDLENYKNKMSYLFDLDFNPDRGSEVYCIDTMRYGNIARFINHSCDPNLLVYPVWIDCLDPNLPRLAFFARRDIAENEEITFDYGSREDEVDVTAADGNTNDRSLELGRLLPDIKCECNAANCRKWVFGPNT